MKKTKTYDAYKLVYLASYVFKNAKSLTVLQICYFQDEKSFFQKLLYSKDFGIKGGKAILKICLGS